jgi:hypothetical protein
MKKTVSNYVLNVVARPTYQLLRLCRFDVVSCQCLLRCHSLGWQVLVIVLYKQ